MPGRQKGDTWCWSHANAAVSRLPDVCHISNTCEVDRQKPFTKHVFRSPLICLRFSPATHECAFAWACRAAILAFQYGSFSFGQGAVLVFWGTIGLRGHSSYALYSITDQYWLTWLELGSQTCCSHEQQVCCSWEQQVDSLNNRSFVVIRWNTKGVKANEKAVAHICSKLSCFVDYKYRVRRS